MSIESVVFISGMVTGVAIILAVIFSYLKGRKIGLNDLLLALIAVVLVSLPLWQTIKFSLKGGDLEVNRLEKKVESNRDTILENNKVLNTQVADLNRKLDQLTADVNALKQKNPDAQVSQEELNRRKQEEALVQENSKYSVFVFYRANRSQDADKIVQALSTAGYGSSKIMTDLSEATRPQPEGTTSVIYTEKGRQRIQDVERILRGLGFGNSIKTELEPRPELGRGDINILLF
jgi:outer membrane murein-binding lipoprotein Lpp